MTRERRTVVLRHAADYERQEEKLARRTKPVTIWAEGTKYQHGRVWKEWTNYWTCFRKKDPDLVLRAAEYRFFRSFIERWLETREYRLHRESLRNKWKSLCSIYLQMTGTQMPRIAERSWKKDIHANGGYLIKKYDVICSGKPKPTVYSDDYYHIISTIWKSVVLRFSSERSRAQMWLYQHLAGGSGARPGTLVEARRKGNRPARDKMKGEKKKKKKKKGEMGEVVVEEDEVVVEDEDEDEDEEEEEGEGEEDEDEDDDVWTPSAEESLVTYGSCELALYPHNQWLLTVDFRRRKGGGGKSRSLKFEFYSSPCLALCPILSFFTMALADNAFEAPDLNTPERLYSLRVESGLRCRPVTFKPSVLSTPLFRNDAGDTLSYSSLRKQTVDLGSASCFREVLTTYGVRRGVANAINGKCSIAQQNQIMTHNDRNGTDATFQSHYQDETVRFNVQQAYTGLPSDEMLLKTSRLMSRHVDPRIMEIIQLTSEEINKLRSDKALMDLKAQQAELRQQIIQEFGRIKDAAGSDLHQCHNRIRSRANNKMRALQVDALNTKKKELRDFYAVDDIQRQLNDLPSTVPTEVPEPTYTHPERARIVEKLFSSELCKVGTDADIQNRVSVLTDLVALCKLKDLPRSRASVPMDQNPIPEPSNDNDAGLSFSSSTVATSGVSSTSRLSFENDMPRLTAPKDSLSVLQQPASAGPAHHQLSVTLPFEPAIGGAHYTVPCFTDLSLTDEDVVKSAETLSESSLDFGTPLDHIIRDTHFPEPAPTLDRVQTDKDVDMLCPVEADLGVNFGVFFNDVIDMCPEPSSNEVQADDNLQPISLDSYTCLFCYFDEAYGSARAEASRYPRAFNMRRHAHRKHLQQTPSRCPDPACAGQQFKDTDHFMNHADGVHGVPF